jgi:hypothetical protein
VYYILQHNAAALHYYQNALYVYATHATRERSEQHSTTSNAQYTLDNMIHVDTVVYVYIDVYYAYLFHFNVAADWSNWQYPEQLCILLNFLYQADYRTTIYNKRMITVATTVTL